MHHKVVCDYQSRVGSVLAKCLREQFLFAKQVSILQLFSFAIMNNYKTDTHMNGFLWTEFYLQKQVVAGFAPRL